MAGRRQRDGVDGGEARQAAFRAPAAGRLGVEQGSTANNERMRRFYESRPPIARGVFIKQVLFGGRLVDYYDFFGLEEPAGERPTTVDGGGGEQGLIMGDQNNTVAPSALTVVDQEDQAAASAGGGGGEEEMEEGEIADRPAPVAGDAPVAAVGPGAAAGNGADRWVIKKKLTCSDVNGSSRLLLPNEEVVKHVLKYINEREITKEGKEVRVWDEDVGVEYTMRLARWNSSGSYLFKDGWRCTIVEKRGLKKGDTVGFYWDPIGSRFVFSVLTVAAPAVAGQGAA